MTVIVNTTVISNFAVIGQLDILRRLFGSVTIANDWLNQMIEQGFRSPVRDLRELVKT